MNRSLIKSALSELGVSEWIHILKSLSILDVARLSRTSRYYRSIAVLWMGEYELDLSKLCVTRRHGITDQTLNGFIRSAVYFCKVVNMSGTSITGAGVKQLALWGVTRLIITGCPNINPTRVAWIMSRCAKWNALNIDIDIYMRFRNPPAAAAAAMMMYKYGKYVRIHSVICEELSVNVCDPEPDNSECHHCGHSIPWLHRCTSCYINFGKICLRDECSGCPSNVYYSHHAKFGKGAVCKRCDVYFCSVCIRGNVSATQCFGCHAQISRVCGGSDDCSVNPDICPLCKVAVCITCSSDATIAPDRVKCIRLREAPRRFILLL